MLAGSDRVLFGAAYYHEYQPYDRLDVDLDLMQEAHFSVIRVGESVWSTWEPENGQFDLEWLEPVLDGAARRGISVILGTPTYAVPPWLARLYPEIAGERSTGERIPWGARQ
jgi:beta-galactosidase